jgi:hypothetical protein
MKVEIATGYPALSYIVELEGEGRGLYAATSAAEASELASRINEFPVLADKLLNAEKTITRLKKQLGKLRRAQKKGGES